MRIRREALLLMIAGCAVAGPEDFQPATAAVCESESLPPGEWEPPPECPPDDDIFPDCNDAVGEATVTVTHADRDECLSLARLRCWQESYVGGEGARSICRGWQCAGFDECAPTTPVRALTRETAEPAPGGGWTCTGRCVYACGCGSFT